jgi:hypothetical protein
VAERLPYLAIVILFAILTGWGIRRRHSRGQVYDRAYVSKLAWTAASLSTAIIGAIFPSVWVFVSYTIHGGSIESNIPPGYSPAFILGSLNVGGAFIAISTVYGYTEHLNSLRAHRPESRCAHAQSQN